MDDEQALENTFPWNSNDCDKETMNSGEIEIEKGAFFLEAAKTY